MEKARVPFNTLIIGLCLCSLVLLTMNVVGWSVFDLPIADSGGYNLFDQAEPDDEFLIRTFIGAGIAGLISSKSAPTNPGVQSDSLSPASPPPKHS